MCTVKGLVELERAWLGLILSFRFDKYTQWMLGLLIGLFLLIAASLAIGEAINYQIIHWGLVLFAAILPFGAIAGTLLMCAVVGVLGWLLVGDLQT